MLGNKDDAVDGDILQAHILRAYSALFLYTVCVFLPLAIEV